MMVEVTEWDKHASLLRFEISYGRKNVLWCRPQGG